MADIQDAVAAGKIVTISQKQVQYNGWTGTGYSVVDPNTGAGAYLIGGGADGAIAYLFGALAGMFLIIQLGGFSLASALILEHVILLLVPALIASLISMLSGITSLAAAQEVGQCFLGGFMAIMSFYTW